MVQWYRTPVRTGVLSTRNHPGAECTRQLISWDHTVLGGPVVTTGTASRHHHTWSLLPRIPRGRRGGVTFYCQTCNKCSVLVSRGQFLQICSSGGNRKQQLLQLLKLGESDTDSQFLNGLDVLFVFVVGEGGWGQGLEYFQNLVWTVCTGLKAKHIFSPH